MTADPSRRAGHAVCRRGAEGRPPWQEEVSRQLANFAVPPVGCLRRRRGRRPRAAGQVHPRTGRRPAGGAEPGSRRAAAAVGVRAGDDRVAPQGGRAPTAGGRAPWPIERVRRGRWAGRPALRRSPRLSPQVGGPSVVGAGERQPQAVRPTWACAPMWVSGPMDSGRCAGIVPWGRHGGGPRGGCGPERSSRFARGCAPFAVTDATKGGTFE